MLIENIKSTESSKQIKTAPLKLKIILSLFFTGIFLINISPILAQNTQSTKNKADQNLKSSARVNPSTLAMEFSLPLGNYPGRGGDSIPVALNYSSKVWSMAKFNYRQEWERVTEANYSYLVYQSTDVIPSFAEKSIGGWTSGLGPVVLLSDFELYNQTGSLYDTSLGELCGENVINGCRFERDIGFRISGSCTSGFAWVYEEFCCDEDHSCRYVERENCLPEQEPGGGGPTGNGGGPVDGDPSQQILHRVNRVRVQMSDGSSKEFRKDDKICLMTDEECIGTGNSYLSVDGSKMRLELYEAQENQQTKHVLYFADGSKYLFPVLESASQSGSEAEKFIDRNGNVSAYNSTTKRWSDTMGREIINPLPSPGPQPQAGTQTYNIKGINNVDIPYKMTWSALQDVLEKPETELMYLGEDDCQSVITNSSPIRPALFQNQPADPLDDQVEGRSRIIRKQRACAAYPGTSVNLFNAVVMAGIEMPDGRKFQFKYNEYGEITKITYPTGGYERFEYGTVKPVGFAAAEIYTQANRGVRKRFVSSDGTNEIQEWSYEDIAEGIQTIAPDGSKSERRFYYSSDSNFGSDDPRGGMVKEERIIDTNGALRSRTLTEWEVTPPQGTGVLLVNGRDPRPVRTISIVFEAGGILATMSETAYETPGENASAAPTDPGYFARLNPVQTKSYHYLSLTSAEANELYENAIVNLKNKFHNLGQVASINQTEYLYDEYYKARGIVSLPFETRVLNPASPSEILAKTQTVYDESNYQVSDSGTLTGNASNTWINPATELKVQICISQMSGKQCRGNPTTAKVWDNDNSTWIQTHTQYDQYGNVRKVWDAGGDADRFAETQYSSAYNFAYPTKIITPAPDPTGAHGTNQTSKTETVYDLTTGLPLEVKDDFDQITRTEYDSVLRPKKVLPAVINNIATGPVVETEYGVPDSGGHLPDNQRFVKIKKQIDANNWDEAITWFDGLGRTVKTQSKDSQGDVFVETQYDNMGRVKQISNPYRQGTPAAEILWSKTRYDVLGRAVESFAPAPNGSTGNSLGTTDFSFSTVSNYVGTVVTSTDASGRKSRSITNALGQLLRVDEATTVDNDLGSLSNPNQPTFYTYSPQGKMVKVQQGKTGEAVIQNRYFKYDFLGRLIRVRQPEQQVNTALNLTDTITGNNVWTAKFEYDVLGNLITTTDANGTIITKTYDKAGRVTNKTYSNEPTGINTPPIEYFYDGKGLPQTQTPNYAKGKLTKISSTVSETRYTQFDNFGRLKQSEQKTPFGNESVADAAARISKYTYNLSGALIEQEYPSGRTVKNEFETDGDLSRISGKATSNSLEKTYASGFSYTPDGKIQRLRLGNGRWESAKFNNRLQVTELALGASDGDGSLWKLAYEYGELNTNGTVDLTKNTGNIAKQTLSFNGLAQPFVQTFKYDSLYRLTEAKETNNNQQTWKQTFGYDRFGNRTNFSQQGGIANSQPTIDAATNRFSANQNYSYDKNGNLTTDPENRGFIFDGENKQIKVTQSGQTKGEYFYDGEGKRVKKKAFDSSGNITEETVFVYDGIGKLVAEYSTAPPPQNPTTNYTATDQLDSPRVITDSNGNVISRRDFMPFGEEITPDGQNRTTNQKYNTGDNIRQKFTGYQKDSETQLDFAEARMYENRHGRFTAVDPLLASGKSANPQTFNRYVYVGNNPINRSDPSGLEWVTKLIKGIYEQKWVIGDEYKKAIADGWADIQLTNGVFRYEGLNNGKEAGVYELRADGSSGWVEIYSETAKSKAEAERKAQEGGLNDKSKALINDLGARAPAMMKIINHATVYSIGIMALPATLAVAADTWSVATAYSFATRPGLAIFYTDGLFTEATSVGGTMIQRTLGGKVINVITGISIFGEKFADRFPDKTLRMWSWASQRFAEKTVGTCILVNNGACNPQSVWNTVEKPILEFNKVVIQSHRVLPPGQ